MLRQRGTRRGAAVAPPREDVPPPPEPPEDPWDEPPPEEDPYVPRQVNVPTVPDAPMPAPTMPAPTMPRPPAPRPRPTSPAASDDRGAMTPPRPSRYSQVAAVPAPPTDLTPAEEASAYSDEDTTVGEGYESAAELLTNVLGAELLLDEAQDGNQG